MSAPRWRSSEGQLVRLWSRRSVSTIARSALLLAVAGCGFAPTPALPTIPPGAEIDCGNLLDQALCRAAVQVAITAQLNPPPIVSARLRRPYLDDECFKQPNPCTASSVIVTLQSGDTVQDVVLARSGDGWVRQ